jgi:hypothetical protein
MIKIQKRYTITAGFLGSHNGPIHIGHLAGAYALQIFIRVI